MASSFVDHHWFMIIAVISLAAGPALSLRAQPSPTEGIAFEPGSWTIVFVPDTQKEAESFPQVFSDAMQWVVDEKTNRNIQLMLHQGDITDNNNTAQWTNAKAAISLLDGEVPYVLAPGNHDFGSNGNASNRTTLMNSFFSETDNSLNDPAQGGILQGFFQPGELNNTYSTLTAPDGRELLIFGLEFGPRQRVVDWANGIAALPQYQDHTAILITHAYMEEGLPGPDGDPVGVRSNWDLYGSSHPFNPHAYGLANVGDPLDEVNDGQELWDDLVSQHDIFKMTLNGHYLDEGDSNTPEGGPATTALQTDVGQNGALVHQMVANYQQQSSGGNGYLRLLEFLPDGETVRVKTYSPTLDLWLNDPRNMFSISLLDLGPPGDVNLDGVISFGTGDPATDDVAAFVAGWKTVLPTDDALTRWRKGDLNLDGVNDLNDAWILQQALGSTAPGNFADSLSVPEPTGSCLIAVSLLGMLTVPRWRFAPLLRSKG